AEQNRERRAEVLHVDTEILRLVTVDRDLDARLVESEVAVGDDEHAALARGVLQLLHLLKDALVARGGIDDHLHRQTARTTRQRRQVERERLHALDLGELGLDQRLERNRRALALFPRLEQHAGD